MSEHDDAGEVLEAAALDRSRRSVRRRTDGNLEAIERSMDAVGAARSIVIDEEGRVLTGRGAAEIAARRGMKVRIVEGDPDTLIAVRRRGLSEGDKDLLDAYDNRAAELAEWDAEVLAAIDDDGKVDLGEVWDDHLALERLLASVRDVDLEGSGFRDGDRPPGPPMEAPRGGPPEGPPGGPPGAPAPFDPPAPRVHVQQVCLYFDPDDLAAYDEAVRKILDEAGDGALTASDAVLRAVRLLAFGERGD